MLEVVLDSEAKVMYYMVEKGSWGRYVGSYLQKAFLDRQLQEVDALLAILSEVDP